MDPRPRFLLRDRPRSRREGAEPQGEAAVKAAQRRAVFGEMARQQEKDLLRTARSMCRGDDDRAEDLVQDALVRAYEAYLDGRFQEGTNFRAWLFRILTNGYLNEHRRLQKWDAGITVETLTSGGEAGPAATHAAAGDVPGVSLLAETLDEPLEQALAALPEPLRLCVVLVDVEELTYEEAAAALSVPIGTIRSRLSRARLQLQSRLRDYARQRGMVNEP